MRHPLALLLPFCLVVPLAAQQRPGQNSPVVAYAYPSGGQAGATVEVTVGGMGLGGARTAVYSGGALPTTFVKHIRPISGVVQTKIRDAIKVERDRIARPAPPPHRGGNGDDALGTRGVHPRRNRWLYRNGPAAPRPETTA
jgi:hypothetical protein